MSTLLEARGLHKSFLRDGHLQPAVTDVTFRIETGEMLALAGQSGSGKSTLALLLARLLDVDRGEIIFDGKDIARDPARRTARAGWRGDIQMVFQDAAGSLDPRRTIRDAVAGPLARLRGLRGASLRQAAEQALDRVGLGAEFFDRRPRELSGGQAARAGIARAIALRPRLLILDEPTAALDVSVQAGIVRLLDTLRREIGMSCLFVSHDLTLLRLLCERVIVMEHGRIVEEGPMEQVFHAPSHPFTARLLASLPQLRIATESV